MCYMSFLVSIVDAKDRKAQGHTSEIYCLGSSDSRNYILATWIKYLLVDNYYQLSVY